MGKLFLFCLAGVLMLGCTVSCKSRTAYEDERTVRAVLEHYRSKNLEITDGKPLTLQDCLSASMTNTLYARFRAAAEKNVDPQAAVEILEKLPSFRFRDDIAARSNAPSFTIRRPGYYNVDLMIGLLDFGLGYWYTKESLYEAAFREQLIRKTAGKIQYETTRSFYYAGGLQAIRIQLEMQLEKIRVQSGKWAKGKGDPLLIARVLRKQAKLEQALHEAEEAGKSASIQLRALMGLYPIPDVDLHGTVRLDPKPLTLPPLSLMEQIALSRRPELFMGDIKRTVSLPACYSFIRQVLPDFPGKKCEKGMEDYMLGARALYDLLQTPDRFAGKGAARKERIASIHAYASALAVMAQVRMAYNEYQTSHTLYKEAKNTLADCEALLKKGRNGTPEYGDMFLDTLQARLDREKAAMRCRIAEGRLLYTMGISKLDYRLKDTVEEELRDAVKAAGMDLRKARQAYSEKQAAALAAEAKKLQAEEARVKAEAEEKLRKETNEKIDKVYGNKRNPALWEEIGK